MTDIKIEDLELKEELNTVEMDAVFGGGKKKKKKKKDKEQNSYNNSNVQEGYTDSNGNVIVTPSFTADGRIVLK